MFIKRAALYFFMLLILVFGCRSNLSYSSDEYPVSAPMLTDSAGFMGKQAASSVFRIACQSQNRMGTCFLHESGNILTAAHVFSGCGAEGVFIILPDARKVPVEKIIADDYLDIAILTPGEKIKGTPIPISAKQVLPVGAMVSTWGFPAGYSSLLPMLSVGYLSGKDVARTPSGKTVQRLVVNAAFNSGNSGGPLIDIETGTVIGIVSSKLAPVPPFIELILESLKKTEVGLGGTYTKPDGTKVKYSMA